MAETWTPEKDMEEATASAVPVGETGVGPETTELSSSEHALVAFTILNRFAVPR
jgi:hypothetical protein